MARIPIRRPLLLQQNGNMHLQKPPIADDATSLFQGGDLVFIGPGLAGVPAAGRLGLVPTTTAVPAESQVVWGISPDGSKTATQVPPEAFFGENHYCFSVEDAIIEMNITNAAGGVGDATVNNGAVGPQLSAVTLGAFYGIRTNAVNYVGVQMVDVSNTTNTLVQVVGIAPNQTTVDYNGRVLVKIPRAKLQG